jgi:hypothetical protein
MNILKVIAMALVTLGAFAASSCCNKAPEPAPTYVEPAK